MPKIIVQDKTREKLSDERRSAGTTLEESQQRYCHLIATTSADGQAVCNIILVKENTADDTTDSEQLTDSMTENALKIIAGSIVRKVQLVRADDKEAKQYSPSTTTASAVDTPSPRMRS